MKLQKAQLTAFGRFQNLSLEFAPGLNVIHGPNEAGKSTLLNFLRGMLYGLQKPGLLKRMPLPELERLHPWNGAAPRGTLSYATQDGRTYRVERDFSDRGFIRVYDAATGQELTAQYRQDRRKELLFAEDQLGLDDEAFASTACIGQMKADDLGNTKELAGRLASLASGGQEDVSVAGVLRLLDQEMAKIGDPERESTKPVAEAAKRLRELTGKLAHAQAVQQENMENERRLADLRQQAPDKTAAVATLSGALAARRRHEAAQRLDKLRGLRQALAAKESAAAALQSAADFPAASRDEVIGLAEAVQNLEREEREARAALDRAHEAGLQTAAQLEAFGPLLDWGPEFEAQTNADFRQYSGWQQDLTGRRAALARTHSELVELEQRIGSYGALATAGTALEARLDELAEQVHQVESEQARLSQERPALVALIATHDQTVRSQSQRRTVAIAAAAVVAVLAVILALALRQPALAGIALLAVPLWFILRPAQGVGQPGAASAAAALAQWEEQSRQAEARLAAAQSAKAEILAEAGCATVAEWKAKLRACGDLRHEQEQAQREAAKLAEEQQRIEQSLKSMGEALAEAVAAARQAAAAGANASDAPDPLTLNDEHLRQFRQVWAAYRRARTAADEANRQEALTTQRLGRATEDLTAKRGALAQRLAAAGAADLAQYQEAYQRFLKYREAMNDRNTAAAVLQQALVEGDEPALESLLAELAGAAGEGVGAAAGAGAGAGSAVPANLPADARDLTRLLEAAQADLAHHQAEVRGLEERLEQAYRDLPDVAGLETEVADARTEWTVLKDRRWVLEQAKAAVEAAAAEVHREFAPHLNEVASAAIASITDGRYGEVRVDQNLTLRVVVPETGELRAVEDLSGGTVDQFYLALRLGMANLLAAKEPVPFLLDDTFVQFDDDRLARAVGYLTEVAASNQVFLFTCHQREVAAARRCQPGVQVIELSN